MKGLGPVVFLQVRDRVYWWGLGDDLSLRKPCRVLLSYMTKQTGNVKCSVEIEMPILLVEIHIASIRLKKHLAVPAY